MNKLFIYNKELMGSRYNNCQVNEFHTQDDLKNILYVIYVLLFFNGLHGIISRIKRSKNRINCFGIYHSMFNWHV